MVNDGWPILLALAGLAAPAASDAAAEEPVFEREDLSASVAVDELAAAWATVEAVRGTLSGGGLRVNKPTLVTVSAWPGTSGIQMTATFLTEAEPRSMLRSVFLPSRRSEDSTLPVASALSGSETSPEPFSATIRRVPF